MLYSNKVLGIHYLELTRNNALGSRFLLEMVFSSLQNCE